MIFATLAKQFYRSLLSAKQIGPFHTSLARPRRLQTASRVFILQTKRADAKPPTCQIDPITLAHLISLHFAYRQLKLPSKKVTSIMKNWICYAKAPSPMVKREEKRIKFATSSKSSFLRLTKDRLEDFKKRLVLKKMAKPGNKPKK